jgi:dTDP-4-dehydrorhamnose reductase
MGRRTALVIGSEGFLGSRISRRLADLNWSVVRSTREELDLRVPSLDWLHALPKIDYVFCCAQSGSMDECRRDEVATRAANVHGMISVLEALRDTAPVPVYLSTNLVFPGDRGDYDECDVPAPTTSYGQQKLEVEEYIRKSFPQFLIVRLTKVFGVEVDDHTLFTSWLDRWAQRQRVSAATDLTISPVYVGDVVRSLLAMIESGRFGVRHVAGPESASVYDFAVRLARGFRVATAFVEPVSRTLLSAVEARPRFQTLGSRDGEAGQGGHLTFDRVVERLLLAYSSRVEQMWRAAR